MVGKAAEPQDPGNERPAQYSTGSDGDDWAHSPNFLFRVKQYLWEVYGHFEVQTAAFFCIKTVFSLYIGQVIHTLGRTNP
jgi:hypothetical protein